MAVVHRKRLSNSVCKVHFVFLNKTCENNKQKQSAIIEIALDLLKTEFKTKNLSEIIQYVNDSNK